jgi:hypothetical protein
MSEEVQSSSSSETDPGVVPARSSEDILRLDLDWLTEGGAHTDGGTKAAVGKASINPTTPANPWPPLPPTPPPPHALENTTSPAGQHQLVTSVHRFLSSGVNHFRAQKYSEAMSELKCAHELAGRCDEKLLQARAAGNLALVYWRLEEVSA